MTYHYGFKFLTGAGTTENPNYGSFAYFLPQPGEKWGAPTAPPNPAAPDGVDCGPGRLHVMKTLDAQYAPNGWWVWYARYASAAVVGESAQKVAVAALQLRRIRPAVLWRALRLGWGKGANLREANLRGANLRGANLREANLWGTNLWGANLEGANLREARNIDRAFGFAAEEK